MDITGKIKLINETKEYGSNGFRKRELVVTTEEQYPQDLLIEFIQDKCDILNSYNVGESVKIDINLRGENGKVLKEKQSILILYKDGESKKPLQEIQMQIFHLYHLLMHLNQQMRSMITSQTTCLFNIDASIR